MPTKSLSWLPHAIEKPAIKDLIEESDVIRTVQWSGILSSAPFKW